MNITGIPISTPQSVDSITVGVAVLSKNLDMIDQLGESMIKMMEQSVQPNLGQNIDIRI
ncbi:MAG: putative motility protein [Clostridiales bacterium]|jgi:hypothetical protein|nr:putative motility protein [Clostridiales bacterium]